MVSNQEKKPNRLLHEKSPYLLQHAYNPVDWFPWGDEAFNKAHDEEKPIFLSIGYSTCHWCHVMEKESFEDSEIAGLLNDSFISIKVDREERPDIDNIYMTVSQMITGSGGWPLNIVMTPDKHPFFAATYIPKNTTFGRIGLVELIPKLKSLWTKDKERVLEIALQTTSFLKKSNGTIKDINLTENILDDAYFYFSENFDEINGGFNGAPKFPTPNNLIFLLRYWHKSGNDHALYMVEKTLEKMSLGGIYDHVGHGFHRYSTDKIWLIPHYEKMLYDQALIVFAYCEIYQIIKKKTHKRIIHEINDYVLRDMTLPEGGFYSAEDADSEGEEGKFYLWDIEEIKKILSTEDADLFIDIYNLKEKGNFIEESTRNRTGKNILYLENPISQLAYKKDLKPLELLSRIQSIKQKLFSYREKRIHPHKDDKILTDWNGLMIVALAKSGRILKEMRYIEAAENAAGFIMTNLLDQNNQLLHRYREDEASISAFVDDYAFLIWGFLELYDATFKLKFLNQAKELTDQMIINLWDENNGGFYFASKKSDDLIVFKKEIYDSVTPSGNSVAMQNLYRMARIFGKPEYEKMANRILKLFSSDISKAPFVYSQSLTAFIFNLGPTAEVVIVGNSESTDTIEMIKTLNDNYIPNKVVLYRNISESIPGIEKLAEFTKDLKSLDDRATAYVCRNFNCHLPTTSPKEMLKLLGVKE